MKDENGKDKENHLPHITKELIDAQNNTTFLSTVLRLIQEEKVSSGKYCISDNGLLHKVMRDYKLFSCTSGTCQSEQICITSS